MIYPCQRTLPHGSPSNCSCIGCIHQVEEGTTTTLMMRRPKSVAPVSSGDETPNRSSVPVKDLIDSEVASEFTSGMTLLPLRNVHTTQSRRVSSSSTRVRSHSRPIPISKKEQIHRYQERQDMAEIESFYANATWRMYRRITKYRTDHPLPDCYFNDNMTDDGTEENVTISPGNDLDPPHDKNDGTTEDVITTSEPKLVEPSITTNKISAMILTEHYKNYVGNHTAAKKPYDSFSQRECVADHDDDEHCMMFELDLE